MPDTTATETSEATMSLVSRDLLGRMTPAERLAGRYLRAPDHGDDDAGGGDGADDNDQGSSGDDAGGGSGDDAGEGAGKDQAGDDADKGKDAGDGDKSLMGGAKGEGNEPDPATLPPEKYELAAPEGFTIDDTLLSEADPVFRELGLTNDAANKLMPLVPKFAEALQAKQNDAFQAMKTDWAKEAKADPDIGKGNWAETEALVAKALDQFGAASKIEVVDGKKVETNPFRALLNDTGLGNHPEMIRMFRRIGAQLGEGGELARSDAGAQTQVPRENLLYPEDAPKEQAT